MSEIRQHLLVKVKESTAQSKSKSHSSYWEKWIEDLDMLDLVDNLQKVYGDHFTPVRWKSGNHILRQLVATELFITNLFSSPKYFLKALFGRSYWQLSKVCSKQGRHMNYSNIVALSAFDLICSRLDPRQATICVIGDGASNFVSLSHIESDKFKKIVSVNLAKIHVVEHEMLRKSGIDDSQLVVVDSVESAQNFLRSGAKIALVSADDVAYLSSLKIDLFVNISSMQEMTKDALLDYFQAIHESRAYLYCCNREEKELPDGTVVRFSEYPWSDGEFLFNEVCPWTRKTLNLTRPLVRRWHTHRHALVKYS